MGCNSSNVTLPSEPFKSKDGGSDLKSTEIIDSWGYFENKKSDLNKLGSHSALQGAPVNADIGISGKKEIGFEVLKQREPPFNISKSSPKVSSTQLTLQDVGDIE